MCLVKSLDGTNERMWGYSIGVGLEKHGFIRPFELNFKDDIRGLI